MMRSVLSAFGAVTAVRCGGSGSQMPSLVATARLPDAEQGVQSEPDVEDPALLLGLHGWLRKLQTRGPECHPVHFVIGSPKDR